MNKIKVFVDQPIGKIKALNGIDNGPVCFDELIDSTRYYKQAEFPYIRLHDTNYPHPREVDIPQIFKDFDADPEDPSSYDFRRTDTYLRQCLDTGAQIIYRLGVSIEHSKIKYTVDPPSDYEKWAKICRGIIKHYNDGWADGFHWNIRYWEIWNEPDLLREDRSKDPMWRGTPEEYYELYKVTSRILKEYDPSLMIGGYAASGLVGEGKTAFFNGFLDMVEREKLPLDFFSWHIYNSNPEMVCHYANIVEAGLKRIGYEHTESILDEWNYAPPSNLWGAAFGGEGDSAKLSFFTESKGNVGGAYAAAVMLALQDTSTDIATFYEGQPINMFGTIFDSYGVPQKPYYSFLAFRDLLQCPDRVAVELPDGKRGLYCCASVDDKGNARIMAANYRKEAHRYAISLEGLDPRGQYIVEKYMMDKDCNYELVESQTGLLSKICLDTWMDSYSAMTMKLTRIK